MIPPKLKEGDNVRVIAPSHSFLPQFTQEMKDLAVKRLNGLGLTVSFGKYVDELDEFNTTTVEHRLEDLHDAFADPTVQAIIPANGGSSVNQLLKFVDYELIKKNPKIFCGLSDITELGNAIYSITGLVTYYGPHFTMLGASRLIDYSLEHLKNSFFSADPFEIHPPTHFSNSEWETEMIVNEGFWTINEGKVEAECIGGNLYTIDMLLGSRYMPEIEGTILFLEENKIIDFRGVQKELQAILNQPNGDKIRGLIIGSFQRETGMTRDLLTKMIRSKKELQGVPVVANMGFGHTVPSISLPIGGAVSLEAKNNDEIKIEIKKH